MEKNIITNRWNLLKKLNTYLENFSIQGNSVTKNIQRQYENGQIDRMEYTIRMIEMESINSLVKTIPYPVTLQDFKYQSPQTLIFSMYKYSHKLKRFATLYGCDLSLLLNMYDIPCDEYLTYHTHVYKVNRMIEIPPSSEYDVIKELHEASEVNSDAFSAKLFPCRSQLHIEKINGAFLYIRTDTSYYKLTGYYVDNPLRFMRKPKCVIDKVDAVDRQITSSGIFGSKMLRSLSLRDIMVNNDSELVAKVTSAERERASYTKKSITEMIRLFNKNGIEYRRRMLTVLYNSGEDKERSVAASIFEQHTVHSELLDLVKGMPWFLQQNLMLDQPQKVELKRLMQVQESSIPLTERVAMMNITDDVKTKAMQKIKEIQTSRENSSKAEQYVEGLLNIPFGIYRKETVFNFATDFHSQLMDNINTCIDDMKNYEDDEHFILIRRPIGQLRKSVQLYTTRNVSNTASLVKDVSAFVFSIADRITELSSDEMTAFPINVMKNWIILTSLLDQYHEHDKLKREYIENVDEIMNASVHGHKEAKLKIKRLIAQFLTGEMTGAVFGIQGPPGTGKTSIAKKGIAKCLTDENGESRPFCFLPLGGSSSGSTLEGHNYTYVGSSWGRIIDMIMTSKCMNPIIYIDELDKVSATESGREIISILTHLTDPSQNMEFNDRYFKGIPFDLSKVIFIFSYNDETLIDPILIDRITEINVDPLTIYDKRVIAQDYLIPEICEQLGYSTDDIVIDEETVDQIVDEYTYEAGVRKLKEILLETVRQINLESIVDDKKIEFPKSITMEEVEEVMNTKDKMRYKKINDKPIVGVINGLYATASGNGGVTIIQVMKAMGYKENENHLELTGSQGDVMKESMACAKTLALNIVKEEFTKMTNFHVHCPSCATKKDGPSAGAAITCAMISRLCGLPIDNTVGLTGEIDLTGSVTAIGGLESKIMGAHRAGVKTVLAPYENKPDLEKYKKIIQEGDVEDGPDVVLVKDIWDVLPHVFKDVDQDKYFNP